MDCHKPNETLVCLSENSLALMGVLECYVSEIEQSIKVQCCITHVSPSDRNESVQGRTKTLTRAGIYMIYV